MISKNIAIKHAGERTVSFRTGLSNLLSYIEKGEPDATVSETWHLNSLSAETGDAEMVAMIQANPRADLPMRHFVASWSPSELPTIEQVKEAAEMMLAETGLKGCLAKCGVHYDTDNVHLHVAVVTVDPETLRMRKTEFLHEALQRFNAKLEHAQGWASEEGARYKVDATGECYRITEGERELPSKQAGVRTMEVARGQRSATDIAQDEVVAAIGNNAINTWVQFHNTLASKGITYERKGSGAVIGVMQDREMVYAKASDISRKAALSSLIKRYGEYEPRSTNVVIAQREVEPDTSMPAELQADWQIANRARNQLRAAKKRDLKALRSKHQIEISELQKIQSDERNKVLQRDWHGLGFLMMAFKSVIAVKQKIERLKLRRKQANERSALMVQYRNHTADWKQKLATTPAPT